jgi:hypothetical protein
MAGPRSRRRFRYFKPERRQQPADRRAMDTANSHNLLSRRPRRGCDHGAVQREAGPQILPAIADAGVPHQVARRSDDAFLLGLAAK